MVMENIFIKMEIHMKECGPNDKKEGEGTLTYNNDRYTYIGTFNNDLFNGWGTLYIIGGEKYEGEWKNGKMEGEGKYFYPFGNTYIGGLEK